MLRCREKLHRLLEAAVSKSALASQLAYTIAKSRLKACHLCLHFVSDKKTL